MAEEVADDESEGSHKDGEVNAMGADEPFSAPFRTPTPPRQPKPGELLFEFIRGSDRATCRVSCAFMASLGQYWPSSRSNSTSR